MTIAAISIGANLGNPVENVLLAMDKLAELDPRIKRSRLYWTKPWGITDQPDFCNAAVLIDVDMDARGLLSHLQAIEKKLGRERNVKWGPRLIDLDILTFGDMQISEDGLTVPHPHMLERVFVLVPLSDVLPGYRRELERFSDDEIREVVPVQSARSCT